MYITSDLPKSADWKVKSCAQRWAGKLPGIDIPSPPGRKFNFPFPGASLPFSHPFVDKKVLR